MAACGPSREGCKRIGGGLYGAPLRQRAGLACDGWPDAQRGGEEWFDEEESVPEARGPRLGCGPGVNTLNGLFTPLL